MDVLVVGAGGREHAIAVTLRESPKVRHVFCAPGNGGTALEDGEGEHLQHFDKGEVYAQDADRFW